MNYLILHLLVVSTYILVKCTYFLLLDYILETSITQDNDGKFTYCLRKIYREGKNTIPDIVWVLSWVTEGRFSFCLTV